MLKLKDLTNPMHIGTNSKKFNITQEKDTKSISEKFSEIISKGDILCLYGNLGVGKTTFVKYLINNIQRKNKTKETEVFSPTFSIVNEYLINDNLIYHYDLHRIKNLDELDNIDFLEDYKESITLIEWPELVDKKIENKIDLFFEYEDNYNKRNLTIKSKNKIINL